MQIKDQKTKKRTGPSRSGNTRAKLRPRRIFVWVLLAAALFLAAANWSWIDAQARAVVVLSSVLKTPILTPAVGLLTEEPRIEDTVIDGMPALVAKPGGEGPWPALLFVNGATSVGRMHPEVQSLARGLARAGYLVVVPDLPGLENGEISEETVSSTLEAARTVADLPDARDGRVGLFGVSTGGALALLAAEDPGVGEQASVVAGIAPYTDMRTVLDVATTGYYRDGERYVPYRADPFLSYVVARSMIAALPSGEDRQALTSKLEEAGRLAPDPLAELRDQPLEDLSPQARSVVELLDNRDPTRFDELYTALPDGVREDLDNLSPLAGAGQLGAHVELASASRDEYFPVSESLTLASIAPDCRVTVTDALDHAEPEPSLSDLPAFVSFDGFVVRSLHEARHPTRA